MGVVRGVILDESVLQAGDGGGERYLAPGSATLLRRLQYSKLRVGICHQRDVSPQKGICHQGDVSPQKAIFLTKTSVLYSFDCISLNAPHASDSFDKLSDWRAAGETCLYVTSSKDDELFSQLQSCGWTVVFIGINSGLETNNKLVFIDKLENLLITICKFNKKATLSTMSPSLIIGYVMKPSREEDFAKRGAFPLYPTQNGLMFVPLSFELPLLPQIQEVDGILHKATDEVINIDPRSLDFAKGVTFSKGMDELARYITDHSNRFVIDPINNIYPMLDRHKIQQILLGLQNAGIKGSQRLRAPHFLKVDCFCEANLLDQLSDAKLSFPVIVKPQVACGVADAHNMALVFKFEDFRDLHVPLPAIIQEYVDHGSVLFKYYVLGDKVFHAVKKSMPNANILLSSLEKTASSQIIFNSLKSLPVASEDQTSITELQGNAESLDEELIDNAAKWLKEHIGLTVFGFDVVVQQGSGDHVLVDLNYLPSFKEVPDSDAIPAFWDAIRSRCPPLH